MRDAGLVAAPSGSAPSLQRRLMEARPFLSLAPTFPRWPVTAESGRLRPGNGELARPSLKFFDKVWDGEPTQRLAARCPSSLGSCDAQVADDKLHAVLPQAFFILLSIVLQCFETL